MTDYVKICPKCNSENPEGATTCTCGFFLGLVRAEPSRQNAPSEAEVEIEIVPEPAAEAAPAGSNPIVLDCVDTGQRFTVRDGDTVGQDHPTGQAEVRLSGIPNVNYVSRHHCRFTYESGAWFVTSLSSSLNGTTLNDLPLAKGGKARVRDGDHILMANVPFIIRLES